MPRENTAGRLQFLPPHSLRPSGHNPRKHFDAASLEDLAASIRTHGLLQPIVARVDADGRHEIVAGERRWRAAMLAGVVEVAVIVLEISDRDAAEIAVLENAQRDNLTPLEEADGFALLVENHGFTLAEIAERIGKSPAFVSNRIALANASAPIRAALAEQRITASAALVFARLDPAVQGEALDRTHGSRQVDAALRAADAVHRKLAGAPFDVAGCATCPKRTDAEARLFAEIDNEAICLDGACWRQKCGAAFAERAAAHHGRVLKAEEFAPLVGDWGDLRHDAPFVLRSDEIECFNDDPTSAKSKKAVEALPVVLAQDPNTGEPIELLERAAVDVVRRKYLKKAPAAPKESPEVDAKRKAEEAERKRCEAVGAALVAAALTDRKGAAARLVSRGFGGYGGEYPKEVLAVAGLKKQSSLCEWARKASKEDICVFLLAASLVGDGHTPKPEYVRRLADLLDMPIPEGFAEPKAGKRGAK